MKAKPVDVAVSLQQLAGFIRQHGDLIRQRGFDPEALAAPYEAGGGGVNEAKAAQEDLKSALRQATLTVNARTSQGYHLFSDGINLVSGILGNRTPLARQLAALRKRLTDQTRGRGGRPRCSRRRRLRPVLQAQQAMPQVHHPLARHGQILLRDLVKPGAVGRHQAGLAQHRQVLGHHPRIPAQALRQFHHQQRFPQAQRGQNAPAHRRTDGEKHDLQRQPRRAGSRQNRFGISIHDARSLRRPAG